MPRIVKWLACSIHSGSAIKDHSRIWPRQLRSPILSFICHDLVNCGFVHVKITCYYKRVWLNWFCSSSAFLNLMILRALSEVWMSALCGRHVCPFFCCMWLFLSGTEWCFTFSWHSVYYVFTNSCETTAISLKICQWQTYITWGIFLTVRMEFGTESISPIPLSKMSNLTNGKRNTAIYWGE